MAFAAASNFFLCFEIVRLARQGVSRGFIVWVLSLLVLYCLLQLSDLQRPSVQEAYLSELQGVSDLVMMMLRRLWSLWRQPVLLRYSATREMV